MISFADAYFKMLAMSYADELKGAIIAQRMGDYDSYHRLTDYVMEATQCELWELVEALDIVNNEAFVGENPFSKRLEIAYNMRKLEQEQRKEADKLHNIYASKNWDAIRKMHKIEGYSMETFAVMLYGKSDTGNKLLPIDEFFFKDKESAHSWIKTEGLRLARDRPENENEVTLVVYGFEGT